MYYTYILLSSKDGKLYIGSTINLQIRLQKHRDGFVRATKYRRPLKLIYYEVYVTRRDAQRRELFLKGGNGHKQLSVQLQETFRKVKYRYS